MTHLTRWTAAGAFALIALVGPEDAWASGVLDFTGLADGNYDNGLDLGPASISSDGLGVRLLTNPGTDDYANRVFCARGFFTFSTPCGGDLLLSFDAPVKNLVLEGQQTSVFVAGQIHARNGGTTVGTLDWPLPPFAPGEDFTFDFSSFGEITSLLFDHPGSGFFGYRNVRFDMAPTAEVPLPAAILLGGSALGALAALRRARRRGG